MQNDARQVGCVSRRCELVLPPRCISLMGCGQAEDGEPLSRVIRFGSEKTPPEATSFAREEQHQQGKKGGGAGDNDTNLLQLYAAAFSWSTRHSDKNRGLLLKR